MSSSSCVAFHAAAATRGGLKPSRRSASKSVPRGVTTTRAAVSAPEQSEVRNSDIVMWDGTKRLQTQVSEIGVDTTCIRSLDWDRDRFDIEFGLEKGTTYNSYVIRGADKIALIDASHEKFRQLYIDTLKVGLGESAFGWCRLTPVHRVDYVS